MGSNLIFLFLSLLLSGVTWFLYTSLRVSGLHDRRMKGFNSLCIVASFWIIITAIATVVRQELFPAVYTLKLAFVNIVPYLSFWFFAHFVELKAADSKLLKRFIICMPLPAVLLLFTNPWHKLYLLSYTDPPQVGLIFIIHLGITVCAFLLMYGLVFRYVVKNYRKSPILIAGGIVTFIPIAIYFLNLVFPGVIKYDYTAIGYFFTIIFVVYVSYYPRLSKTRPGAFGDALTTIAKSHGISTGMTEDVARLISRESCLALAAYRVKVWNYDEKIQTLACAACYNNSIGKFSAQEDIKMQGVPGFEEYLKTEKIIAINNVKQAFKEAGLSNPYDSDVCAALFAPVRIDQSPVAMICVEQNHCTDFPEMREWSLEEQSFVSSLADLLALTITNADRQSLIRQLETEQAALIDSEERIQLILDVMPLSVNLIDKNMQCIYVNEEAVRLYGLSDKQEYIKLFYSGRLSNELGAPHIERAFKEGFWRGEMTFLKPPGSEPLPCEITLIRVKYKDDYVIAAFARDLREEKAAIEKIRITEEEKLTVEEAHQNLKVILEVLPIGIAIMSRKDGALFYVNKAGLDLFNCKSFEEDVAGRSSIEFMAEIQPDGKTSLEYVTAMRLQEKAVVEMLCLKKTGETFLARIAYCIINYNGMAASLNVIEDITAEMHYKKMLQDIAVKEQEANQLKTRFLANMSHEIRTPMNAIIGMTELALREEAHNAKNEHIHTVKQAASNLLAIINDILDFSKIEAGKMEIIEEEYSIESMLNDIVSIIRMRVNDSQVRFVINADCNIPRKLYGDETRIRQVILNILNNAVKYTERGYVSFGIYAEFTGGDSLNLIIEVKDTGVGIKNEDIGKLFNDFTKLDQGKNRNIEGVGLGLVITKNILDMMNGSITVQSEYGAGSAFTIILPQKFSSRKGIAEIENPKDISALIYERRDIYAESLVYTFKNMGVNCTLVSSGTELYKIMEKQEFDYLLISFALFENNEETIVKFGKKTKTIILSEFGEAVTERNFNVLFIPVYCTQIANIINGVYGNISFNANKESVSVFSAKDTKVLVVDDINTNLRVVQGLLSPYNIQVDLCSSGLAAIEAVQSKQYDLVFMDHKMPGMDGVETTRRIREREKTLPIIALTANAVSGTREMFIENGFNDFLSKPIETVKLHEILKKWIPKDKQE